MNYYKHFPMKRYSLTLLVLLFCQFVGAQQLAPFRRGDRVAFVGNSITDGGHYHSYIWLYYMTHYPNMRLWMDNCGVGGDTSGQILARLDDDVLSRRPTVLTFTFGMNDTGYQEHNGEEAQAFADRKVAEARTNFLACEQRLKEQTQVRKIMLGTSPYDQNSTFNNEVFKNKNNAMQRLVAIQDSAARANHWEFFDFNAPIVRLNSEQQAIDPTFTLCGTDRIHPDNDGHAAMAYLFLQAQGMVGQKVADVELDATTGRLLKAGNCRISHIRRADGDLQFDYLAKSLPYPLDTVPHGWGFTRPAALVERVIPSFVDDLSDEHLCVKGLSGTYQLTIDKVIIDTLQASQLAAGINLARYRHTPQYQQACVVMTLNECRWDLERRLREWAWVNYTFLLPEGHMNDYTEAGAECYRRLCLDNAWLASRRGSYDMYFHPELQQATRDEISFLVDRIYSLNKPQKRHVALKRI